MPSPLPSPDDTPSTPTQASGWRRLLIIGTLIHLAGSAEYWYQKYEADKRALHAKASTPVAFQHCEDVAGVLGELVGNSNDPLTNKTSEDLVRLLSAKKGDTVAVLGCGTGHSSFLLARQVGPRGKVWATDIDPKTVEYVVRRASVLEVSNLKALLAKPDKSSLAPHSVGKMLVNQAFARWLSDDATPSTTLSRPKVEQLVASIKLALAPRGTVWVHDLSDNYDVIDSSFRTAGFRPRMLPGAKRETTCWKL
jgi:SAM-dependent methyltransferase